MKPCLLLLLLLLDLSTQAQRFTWVRTGLNNSTPNVQNYNIGAAVAYANGRVASTGYFHYDIDFDGVPLTGQSARNAFAGVWSSDGTPQWLQGGTGPTNIQGTAVGMDAAGNTYVTYYLRTPARFDTVQIANQSNQVIAVLIKYGGLGQAIWARRFIAGRDVRIHAVAVAFDGTCTVGGEFGGTLALPGQPALTSGPVNSANAGFVARFEAAGTCQWIRSITADNAVVYGVAVDGAGETSVAGGCGGNVNFGNGVMLNSSRFNGFVAKYSSQGIAEWAQQVGRSTDSDCWASSTALDANGNTFVCGIVGNGYGDSKNHTATFGPFTVTTTGGGGYADGFVAKYSAQGQCQWVRTMQGGDTEWVQAVATNQRGEVYVGGAAYGGVGFEGQTLPAATFGYQGFVAKYSGTGDLRWLQGYGGSGVPFGASNYLAGTGLATDGVGHLYISGAFMGNTNFGTIYKAGSNQGVNYPYVAALEDREIITATATAKKATVPLDVYPNPSTGLVEVQWRFTKQPAELVMLDALGRTVHTVKLSAGRTGITLQAGQFPRGIYMLRLTVGSQIATQRLILE